jgi:hypothetical protein
VPLSSEKIATQPISETLIGQGKLFAQGARMSLQGKGVSGGGGNTVFYRGVLEFRIGWVIG